MVKRPIHDLRFFAAARLEGDPSASTSRSEGGKRDAFVNAVEEWSTRGLVEKESLAVKDVVGEALAVEEAMGEAGEVKEEMVEAGWSRRWRRASTLADYD